MTPTRRLQRLGAGRPERHVAHFGELARGQLQGVELVIVPAAQVDRVAFTAALGQSHDVHEEIQALLGLGRHELEVGEVREIEGAKGRLVH
jgi:hypothetical protein